MKTTIRELRKLILESVSRTLVKDIKSAFYKHIKDNDRTKLDKLLPTLLDLQEKGELPELLNVGEHEYAYRVIDVNTEKQLKDILGITKFDKEKYGTKRGGVLKPVDGVVSSWTVNPRSLVYSCFFCIVKKPILMVFKARTKNKKNRFLGNPDRLAGTLEVGDGYSLERETLGIGDIQYDKVVYGIKREDQSLEGLAMDLINKIHELDPSELTNDYYFPEKL